MTIEVYIDQKIICQNMSKNSEKGNNNACYDEL